MTPILFIWLVVWFFSKFEREEPRQKLFVYNDISDDLFLNGVYRVGDEFK